MAYCLEFLIAFDRLVNALLRGSSSETLSSRAYRMQQKGQPYWGRTAKAINGLFFWQPNHCQLSYTHELARGHLPDEFGDRHA